MAMGRLREAGQVPPAEINMVPLIDVMLVLLVIFMVTAPLITHAVKLDLPHASSAPVTAADKVALSIDAAGQTFWDGKPLTPEELKVRLVELGRSAPGTELHLYADESTRYAVLAGLMAEASSAGLAKIGFVSVPKPL
ncbi:ExbD/TolR family protein [Diaphorobacter caeni]|uniref:ExbD/TolR family protein n=1 Tax=Diaphorobacter caeni TaxID=2784387 RepID=UPI00188DE744|nr:biopolymer transporter ExbD [Diaphorobacter caeni]MBF5004510.1 biopolymer transporter ExbD [Diaphorobacter caeni]